MSNRAMPRFFLDPDAWGDEAALTGDEARHCARVLRAAPGDSISVFDGLGRGAEARISSISNSRVELLLGECCVESAPKVEVVLAIGVLKGKAMDWLLQKAVELGVSEIQPLSTRFAVAQPGEGKEEKWRRAVLESCKQCGRSRIPKVLPVQSFQQFLEMSHSGHRLIASLQPGAVSLRERLSILTVGQRVTFLVGPEGDFSESEYSLALDSQCTPVNLGTSVLRSETAAIYCLACTNYAVS